MKKVAMVFAMLVVLSGCKRQYEDTWDMYSVSTGGRNFVGEFLSVEACHKAIESRVQIDFGKVETFTASDEEEQGLGMVLMCVPGRRQVR